MWMDRRCVILCTGRVSQTTSLAQLLEHDGVHATTEIFIEERLNGCLLRTPFLTLVVIHRHIDVLSLIRSHPYLRAVCRLMEVRLGGRCRLELLRRDMRTTDDAVDGFHVGRSEVHDGSLIVVEVLQLIEQSLRVSAA